MYRRQQQPVLHQPGNFWKQLKMKALSMNSLLVATLIASTSIFRISALPGASPVLLNRAELVLPRQCSWAGHCAGTSCLKSWPFI